jgi:hypothetical protein
LCRLQEVGTFKKMMSNETSPNNQNPRKTNKKLLAIVAVAVIVIVVIGSIIALSNQQQPFPTPVVQPIAEGQFTVNAGSYTDYNFTVPADFSGAWVSGSFTVSDSAVNGIVVYVMDDGNFTKWQNGQTANTYYDSGQVNAGDVTIAELRSGTYYLVFDNTFSAASKNVTAGIGLLLL